MVDEGYLGRNADLTMNAIRAGLILVPCLVMLGGCSRGAQGTAAHASHGGATGTRTVRGNASPDDPSAYPYDLWIGRAVNRVDREAEAARLKVELVRWADGPYGGREALFRVTNPGDRAVLVWNVRQQVWVAPSNAPAGVWDTRQSDYPGRGWEHSIIPAGGSEQFPMSSPGEGDWRVCLLYSRAMPGAEGLNRRFDGNYESIGPRVREDDEPKAR